MAHELSITVIDERLNGGRPTNIPLVVPGGRRFRPGEAPTLEDERRAIEHALKTGRHFGAFGTIEEAVEAARARSREAETVRPKLPAGQTERPQDRAVATHLRETTAPQIRTLREILQDRLGPEPTLHDVIGKEDLAAGAQRTLEGLRQPMWPMPGARVQPLSVVDALPRNFEAAAQDFTDAPPMLARPWEFVTPREQGVFHEVGRIQEHLRDLPPTISGLAL